MIFFYDICCLFFIYIFFLLLLSKAWPNEMNMLLRGTSDQYVLTLFFIHTTSTCIVRLGDICNALRYSNQNLLHDLGTNIWL
jgi:hypothetical protein